MKRTEARKLAFELLFEHEFEFYDNMSQTLDTAAEEREIDGGDAYVKKVTLGVEEHIKELDGIIGKYAVGYKIDRISHVSRSILRLALYEILYVEDVPAGAAINEAVELAKTYEGEESGAFVNGILGEFVRKENIIKIPEEF